MPTLGSAEASYIMVVAVRVVGVRLKISVEPKGWISSVEALTSNLVPVTVTLFAATLTAERVGKVGLAVMF